MKERKKNANEVALDAAGVTEAMEACAKACCSMSQSLYDYDFDVTCIGIGDYVALKDAAGAYKRAVERAARPNVGDGCGEGRVTPIWVYEGGAS